MVRRKTTPSSYSPSDFNKETNKRRTTEVGNYRVRNRGQNRVLQEIRYLKKTTKLVIPKLPFARLVKSIIQELFPRGDITRLQSTAIEALQEATEMYLVQFFEDAVLLAFHAKRVTLMKHDMILMRRLRGRDDIVNR